MTLVLASTVLLGLGLGLAGTSVGAAIPGVVLALAVLAKPLLGLIGLGFVIPFEAMTMAFTGGGATATRLLGMLVAGAWVLRKLLRQESWRHILHSGLLAAVLAFAAFAMFSGLWATVPAPAVSESVRFAMWISLTVLAIDLLRSWEDVHAVALALVAGGLISASLVILQFFGTGIRRAGGGIAGGINATGFVLVTLLPLAFYLLRHERIRWKLFGAAYVGLGTFAVTLTFSRMALLTIPLLVAIEYAFTFRQGQGRIAVILLTAVALLIGVRFLPQERLAERIGTIGPYVQETIVGDASGLPAASERGFHIRVALALFRDHPLVGAGYLNYGYLFRDQYQFEVAGSDALYQSVRSPHGTAWGILADLGIVGAALWLTILIVATHSILRARGAVSRKKGREAFRGRLLVHAVSLVLAVQVLYMGYQEVHRGKLFWLALGLAVAVRRISELTTRSPQPHVNDPSAVQPLLLRSQ